jgi:hypothetical protein
VREGLADAENEPKRNKGLRTDLYLHNAHYRTLRLIQIFP